MPVDMTKRRRVSVYNFSEINPTSLGPGAYNLQSSLQSGDVSGRRIQTAPSSKRRSTSDMSGSTFAIRDRFDIPDATRDVPPPGAYDVEDSYRQVTDRGKLSIRSAFRKPNHQPATIEEKRDTIFDHIESHSPGPAWYDVRDFTHVKPEYNAFLVEGPPSTDKSVGFLSRDARVPDAIRDATRAGKLPGPCNYNINQHSLEKQVKQVSRGLAIFRFFTLGVDIQRYPVPWEAELSTKHHPLREIRDKT